MSSESQREDDMYDNRYGLSYSIHGVDLDVDALLRIQRPAATAEIGHRGEVRSGTRPAKSSGVNVQLTPGACP